MTHAPNCVRMAIAIQTADTFSIKQLFLKLCQKTCDGESCSKLAPYLDVFTLARRCLSVSGGCLHPCGPMNKELLNGGIGSYDEDRFPSRGFFAMVGQYCNIWANIVIGNEEDRYYCDYRDIKAAF